MDLDALRRAALSSKKRKLATAQPRANSNLSNDSITSNGAPSTTTTTTTTSDKEEGEIDDDNITMIKDECKEIISQLLSYGIPSDYMLSIGVSREILKVAFQELHLDSSLIPPSPNLSAQSLPFQPSQASPFDGKEPSQADSAEMMIDYDALEQEKRKKLLARKAALKARNQRQAQNLESELESLFASTPAPTELQPTAGEEADIDDPPPLAKRPRHSEFPGDDHSPAQQLHALREAIDHTEETAQIPSQGPFAYNPSFSRPSTSQSSQRRPVATDLEHLPSHRLSENALSRQRVVGGFGGNHLNGGPGMEDMQSLVIEISDDEEEEEGNNEEGAEINEDGDGDARMKEDPTQRDLSPNDRSRTPLPSLPILSTTSSQSKAAQVAEILRQRQLEEKELEIKRIMDRIKDMEARKSRAASTMSEDAPVAAQKELEVGEIDSRSFLSPLFYHPVYRPYASTLSRYPLLGGRPSSSLSISFEPSPSSNSESATTTLANFPPSPSDVGSAGLSTFVAQKHQLDPSRKWCKAESLGGVCRDGSCKSVHERDFVAKGTFFIFSIDIRPTP
ncbi:uncharacterized protein JCM6883_006269 [Sporobolomyces salmoneus]|uniref:uncharacterized protein n=1 Tax=Sporobolomyces salmoneus TaxID=183962 RepID=UPI00318178C4